MTITTRTRAVISGAVAGLALLGVAAIPAFANNHNQSAAPSASGTTVTQAQATPTEAQRNQRMQQMRQMMERCNSMMSMMRGMMDNGNMPGMMNGQPSQPGQGMMDNGNMPGMMNGQPSQPGQGMMNR